MNRSISIDLPDNGHLHVQIDGPQDAPWIVLSNSVLTDLNVWNKQRDALSGQYRILTYDQRGHGLSSTSSDPMNFDKFGEDLLRILDACHVDQCSFVGLSMGVPTGLAAYANSPERFARFVAVDGIAKSGKGREEFWLERRTFAQEKGMATLAKDTVSRWMASAPAGSAMSESLEKMIAKTPVKGFVAATFALQDYDYSTVLASITCPFLSLTGSEDGAMPEGMRTQFNNVLNRQFAVIENAGHLPNFQQPAAFNSVLSNFLETSP